MICSAKTSAGNPCRRYAVAGAVVCPTHGGAAPQVRAKATLRLVEAGAMRLLDREGAEPVEDPLRALRELAGEAVGLKDLLARRVAELSDGEWVSRTKLGAEQASAWLAAYERALDRTGKLLVDLARLGLGERYGLSPAKLEVVFVGAEEWHRKLLGTPPDEPLALP